MLIFFPKIEDSKYDGGIHNPMGLVFSNLKLEANDTMSFGL